MNRPRRNYDIPELRRLDVAHHLPAQQDYKLIEEMGGSRIITSADGCTIMDGDGNQDLVYPTYGVGVEVVPGNGDGTFDLAAVGRWSAGSSPVTSRHQRNDPPADSVTARAQ